MDRDHAWKSEWDRRAQFCENDLLFDRGLETNSGIVHTYYNKQLLNFIGSERSMRILDVGCGTGDSIELIKKTNGSAINIFGLDYCDGAIYRCNSKLEVSLFENVNLFIGSADNLMFKDCSFDRVICISVLQYLSDSDCDHALYELLRVTQRGKYIYITIHNSFSPFWFVHKIVHCLYIGKLLRKLRILGEDTCPKENIRSYLWYLQRITSNGGKIVDISSFNILPKYAPQRIIPPLLRLEILLRKIPVISHLVQNIGAVSTIVVMRE